jgi:hypothetical protein
MEGIVLGLVVEVVRIEEEDDHVVGCGCHIANRRR